MTIARANATRCCCPPESWVGLRSAYSAIWTASRASMTWARWSAVGTLRTFRPKATFWATVMWGQSA